MSGIRRYTFEMVEAKDGNLIEIDDYERIEVERDALQQRLTIAEQFVQKLVDCSKGQDSIATGYLSDILDSLKPAEGEAS